MVIIVVVYVFFIVFDNVFIVIFFGIIWGMFIFNLDCFIVFIINKRDSFFDELI